MGSYCLHPKLSRLLAYETGVHIGNGNLYQYKNRMYRVTYGGNLTNEAEYYKDILYTIVESLYNVKPVYYELPKNNSAILIINSKAVFNFKKNILMLPVGKKSSIKIPPQMWIKDEILARCIEGIGDTDFSLSFKKDKRGIPREPRLELFTHSRNLLRDPEKALHRFNFTFNTEEKVRRGHREFRLRIYGKRNLQRWIELIGFKNPYHKAKLAVWKKLGYVPPGKNYQDYQALLRL